MPLCHKALEHIRLPSPSTPHFPIHSLLLGIDEWPAKLTVTNNLDLWLEIVPGVSKKGVVLKDVDCLASKWQEKAFGKAGLRLLPPKGEIEYNVTYSKAGVPFHAEARFGDFAATLMITKVLATLPVPGIGRLDDPVIFLEFWDKVRKIDSIKEAASALKSGKIADASKKLFSLFGEKSQLALLRQAFAAFKIEVSKKAFSDFLTVSKIFNILNILGDQITLAIQTKAGVKPVRVSFHLEPSDPIRMSYENTRLRWSQLEKQLQRRYQLIPKLADTVKSYVHHESDVLAAVTMQNQKCRRAVKIQEIAKANGELTTALYRLIIILNKYPNLKSHQDYISLYDELGGIENRIAVTKQNYNEAVEHYNYRIKRFSGKLTAFQPAALFKVEQREEQKKAKIVKF